MTKKDFIDYFRALLPRVDKTGKYHPEVISHAIERAVNDVLCMMYLRFPDLTDPYIREYTDVSATYNSTTKLWEASLTAGYVPVPVVGSGVREVALVDSTELVFIPVRYDDLMRTQDFSMKWLTTIRNYSVVGNKIVFIDLDDYSQDDDDAVGLRVRQITSVKCLDV